MSGFSTFGPGAADLETRAELLADRLTDSLKPLARVAYNYAWSWLPDGDAVFRDINPHRWGLSGANPVRFLSDLWPRTMERAEENPELLERIQRLTETVRPTSSVRTVTWPGIDGPVAFFCAEFGFHVSLPIYSGGLGVLAGDILKEASDQALPMVGIGLFYRRGYFRQRLDLTGRQHEYWVAARSQEPADGARHERRPNAAAADADAVRRAAQFQVWRVDVGRVPLLLLDTEIPANDEVQRWTTARLYEGNRAIRLAQYGLLGIGGARVLERSRSSRPSPSERGPSGARAARAGGRTGRRRHAVRGGARRGARAGRLHDPHAGARGQRDVPAGGVPGRVRRPTAPARNRRRGVPRRSAASIPGMRPSGPA